VPFIRVATLTFAASVLSAHLAAGTTLVRHSLDQLAADNDVIVHAKVLSLHSYWNAEHSFILTDVRVTPLEILKGSPSTGSSELTFTVMGGTVGDVSVLLVDGPGLVAGSEYVLFLAHGNLPGARGRLTIRDLEQGVFQVDQGRAFSQAQADPLLPDAAGRTDAPGGTDGVQLDELIRQIRDRVHR